MLHAFRQQERKNGHSTCLQRLQDQCQRGIDHHGIGALHGFQQLLGRNLPQIQQPVLQNALPHNAQGQEQHAPGMQSAAGQAGGFCILDSLHNMGLLSGTGKFTLPDQAPGSSTATA